jgi:CelD/BcsL family acetyltransferase involved in cellulose biosynthesis
MNGLTVDILHPRALARDDLDAWRARQAAIPAFGNPLLGPDFAQAVGAVRKDARAAIWRDARGAPKAFFAYHRRPQGFGRPIGAPFCDYHAVIGGDDLGLDPTAILAGAGLKAFRLSGLVDPFKVFSADDVALQTAYRIVLDRHAPPEDAGLAYLERLKASSANRFKNFRRYSKRLEQAFGPVRLVPQDLDPSAFDRLLGWKRQQLARTGLHDFLRPAWIQALMRRLFETPGADTPAQGFSGLMISLYAGDHHVAGHFGVRLGSWYHPWIGATAQDLESHGAGFVHQWKAVEGLGLHTYDLGPGSDHWKRMFTADVIEVGTGLIAAPTLAGRLARAGDRLWSTPPLDRIGLAGRVGSRLDQIAAIEPAWSGRARGVLAMASAVERRAASRRSTSCVPNLEAAAAPAQLVEGRTP